MSLKDFFVLPLDRIVSTPLNKASSLMSRLLVLALLMGMALPATAALTIENITWGVKGLDSNDVSTGPNQFPEGARICSDIDALNTTVTFDWNDANGKFTSSPSPDPYINLRDDTLDVLSLSIPAGTCQDAYFEVEINRDATVYDNFREFFITADDNAGSTATTPANREVYVERLISQSRNSVDGMEFKVSTDPDASYVSVAAGGTLTLVVGETYNIKLQASTATQGYEQLESFINFPNVIFQVITVDTSYSSADGLGTTSSNKLYSDACVWDDDTTSANYRSCLLTGRAGGTIESIYTIKILQIPGAPLVNPQPLTTLVHDFSGSSYHYNADFSTSVRYALIISSTIEKSFVPKSIAPNQVSTLTFNITNPKSDPITLVNFIDNLPDDVRIAETPISYSGCGGAEVPASFALDEQTLDFSNISITAFGTCTISVTVTSSIGGVHVNTTENLFIDDTFDTLSNATDILVVGTFAGPTTCTTKDVMATWTMPTSGQGSGGAPPDYTTIHADVSPLSTITSVVTTAAVGSGESIVAGDTGQTNAWELTDAWPSVDGVPGVGSGPYFEFQIDSSKFGGVAIEFSYALMDNGDWASGQNNSIYIYSSADGAAYTLAGSVIAAKGSWEPTIAAITAATSGVGITSFRIITNTRNANKSLAQVLLDNITISGCRFPDPPTMTKSFGTDPLALGGVSTLTFTFQNPDLIDALTGVGFSDTLPAGIVVADTPNVTFPACSAGSITSPATDPLRVLAITAVANTSLIDMTEVFTLPVGANCSFTVDVKGVVDGTYTNTTTNITSTNAGPNLTGGPNVGYGQDTITVNPTPQISKVFGTSSILTGETTTLSFSITNPSIGGTTLTNVAFSDTLPGGVIIDSPNGLTGSCGGGTITATAGASVVSLTGATLLASASCSFTINVQGTTVGLKTNTTGVVSSDQGVGNTATAELLVKDTSPALAFLKQVSPTITGPWTNFVAVAPGADIFYRFTIENTGDIDLLTVDISDPTLDGLSPATTDCVWTDGDGGSLTAAFTLPLADADEGHIATCVLGAYTAVALGVTNTATTSNGSSAINASDTAEYATTNLSLDKRVTSGDPYANIGDTITYEYDVTTSVVGGIIGPVTVADNKTTVSCDALTTIGDSDAFLDPGETLTCTSSYVTTATDVLNDSVTNIATATIANAGTPVVSNSDTVTVQGPGPSATAVTLAKVELTTIQTSAFLDGLGVAERSAESLLELLAAWDADLATSLADADNQALIDALNNYLDPDGDGKTAVIRWDTLEERGTIGFYVDRKVGDGEWERINSDMLPGLIVAPMGGEYQLADPSVGTGEAYQYQLIEQEARGTTQTYGPFKLEIEE